jgi:hypothetical protein
MKLVRRLRRLELACEQVELAPLSDEERRRRIIELLQTVRERKAKIDAALAGGNPNRRRWAERTLAASDTPETRAWVEEAGKRLEACKDWLLGRAPAPAHGGRP